MSFIYYGYAPYRYVYNYAYNYSLISFVISIIMIIAMWKLFEKANKPGWAAIIPIYNIIVLFQIARMNPWLLLLVFIPLINFIALPILLIMLQFKIALAFGKEMGFGFGLLFLGFIFYPILAFSNAKYLYD